MSDLSQVGFLHFASDSLRTSWGGWTTGDSPKGSLGKRVVSPFLFCQLSGVAHCASQQAGRISFLLRGLSSEGLSRSR